MRWQAQRGVLNLYRVSAIRLLGDRPGQVLQASTRPK
jgi:hypothetical protein